MKYFVIAVILFVFASAFSSTQKAKIAQGDYLVNRAVMCVGCHTPRGADHKLDMTKHMQGMPMGMPGAAPNPSRPDRSPDVTRNGLIGKWGKKATVEFLMTGKTPDGKPARPPMPAYRFNRYDAESLYEYLSTLPPKK